MQPQRFHPFDGLDLGWLLATQAALRGDHPCVVFEPHDRPAVSIGYASFPIGPQPLDVAWERAIGLVDTALYLAKAHGRNRAYSVRALQASDEQQLEAVGRALKAA